MFPSLKGRRFTHAEEKSEYNDEHKNNFTNLIKRHTVKN